MATPTAQRSVIPLLSSWEAYCKTYPEGDLPGFGRWLLVHAGAYSGATADDTDALSVPTLAVYSGKEGGRGGDFVPDIFMVSARRQGAGAGTTDGRVEGAAVESATGQANSAGKASTVDVTAKSLLLIARLNRILNFLSKPVLKKIGFPKDKEFAVLVQIALMDGPNKKEVCRELLMEGSTGVEITRRLAKRGLILEGTDENDRRSARLTLTEKGQKTLQQAYEQLGMLHTDFLDLFNGEEKLQLAGLLTRLDVEHTQRIANLLPVV